MNTNTEMAKWYLEFIKSKVAFEMILKQLELETNRPGEFINIFNLFSDKITAAYHAHLFDEPVQSRSKTPVKLEVIK